MSHVFVCIMGIGTVFVGLICIVFICMLMSFIIKSVTKKSTADKVSAPAVSASQSPISNKQEIVAAVCAVIAHETGADAKNIRVLSFKKIG